MEIHRLQRGDDLHDLVVLSRAFFEEYAGHHEELFRIGTLNDQEIIDYFSRFLDKDDHAAFVALRDGAIVGYVTACVQVQPSYWQVRRVGHLSGLMVSQDCRREGLGTRLLEQAKAYFKQQGVKYFTVYTAASNRIAIEFYMAHGLEHLHCHLVGVV